MAKKRADQSVRWSRRDKALLYHPEACKPTSMLVAHFFEGITMGDAYGYNISKGSDGNRTLVQELEARGYDITTLRFSVHKKAT